MLHIMQILAIILVAIAMAPALAHAFEFPGKMRLNRDAYVTVQAIYYPGFTIAGISEPLSLIAVIVLLLFTPPGTVTFWLTLVALFGLLGMQVIYWTRTHPTNKYWLQSAEGKLGNIGSGFFAFDPTSRTEEREVDWTKLRDRWEYSHITRAGLAFLSFLCLLLAIVVQEY
jgi:hypothetical protein